MNLANVKKSNWIQVFVVVVDSHGFKNSQLFELHFSNGEWSSAGLLLHAG